MNKQKFAWVPTRVWNMKFKKYQYSYIWLVWYWYDEDNLKDTPSEFHILSDNPFEDTRMWIRNKVRSSTNKW